MYRKKYVRETGSKRTDRIINHPERNERERDGGRCEKWARRWTLCSDLHRVTIPMYSSKLLLSFH